MGTRTIVRRTTWRADVRWQIRRCGGSEDLCTKCYSILPSRFREHRHILAVETYCSCAPELLHLYYNGIMRVTSCLLLTFILTACQSPFGSRVGSLAETVQVRIPQEKFVLPPPGHSVSVPFSVSNRGSTAIFVDRCGSEVSAVVDRRHNGGWHQYMGAYCLAHLSSFPLELAPDETVQSYIAIREPGEYRIRIGVRTSLSNATEWEWTPVSNRFTVR